MRPETSSTARPAVSYDAWRHRYTLGVTGALVALLTAGGLVTSTGSGLAVPDWPLSFGQFFPPMVGGVLFEHGHRLIAAAVGLLIVILGAWYWAREPRTWARRLALLALFAVVVQGILGGVTVLLRLPTAVSVAHACLAQAVFAAVGFLALATSRRFVADRPEPLVRDGKVPTWSLGALACGLIYAQLVLGAVVRHTGAGLAIRDFPLALGRIIPPLQSAPVSLHFAHRVVAVAILLIVAWIATRVMKPGVAWRDLGAPAATAVALVLLQIGLGGAAVLTRLAVLPATLHVVNGALLLAACGVLTVRAWRGDRAARQEAPVAGAVPDPAAGSAGSIGARLGDYLALTKPRVTFMVLVTTAAGFYLGTRGPFDAGRLVLTLIGTLLVAAGTSALNQYAEREADSRMLRTRDRPLPAGRLAPSAALLFAVVISIVGLGILATGVNAVSAILAGLTLVLYIVVYTPLKRMTPLSTLIGAVPGALPPLIGWAAAQGSIAPGGLALFAILFIWQLPHSLAIARIYREDYARGGFRLLPVTHPDGGMTERQILLHAVALLPVSLTPTILGIAGPVYFAGALVLGLGLAASAVPVLFDRSTRAARRVLLVSVVYLPVLLGLLAFDRNILP